mgnify:CR=1 FL=1
MDIEGPLQALQALGVDAASLAQARAQLLAGKAPPTVLSVLPECWHAVQVFIAMGKQWEWVTAMGVAPYRVRLRLELLPMFVSATRQMPHRRPLSELLPQLLLMQDAALNVWAKS